MANPVLTAALSRLDAMDETLATLRLLASAYAESGDDGSHVAGYLSGAVSEAARDLAQLAKTREVSNV